ncbi:MAG: ATP-binding protein [Bacteroidetes bacterium]|nr:ATP-binding protein [Bacteroidota bacterium]
MRRIVVMSGKGGTGKTTITAALSHCAGTEAVIADCDVDASNLHLLLRPDVGKEERFMGGWLPMFDSRSCTLCGMCADACAWSAIILRNGQYEVDPGLCEGCGVCAHVCPDGYITMTPRVTGMLFASRSRFRQSMYHARLGIGQENSGKLVAKVASEAMAAAERERKEFLLIDGPPGIGCPAIAALTAATEVLIVTEATHSALHDLCRLIELIAQLSLPAACIINKADLDRETANDIHRLCAERCIPVLAAFPWSEDFPESLRQGRTLLELCNPQWQERIGTIWNHISTGVLT